MIRIKRGTLVRSILALALLGTGYAMLHYFGAAATLLGAVGVGFGSAYASIGTEMKLAAQGRLMPARWYAQRKIDASLQSVTMDTAVPNQDAAIHS